MQGTIVALDIEISLNAAKLGVTHKIPLADSIILATGLAHEAIIWSQDADFKGLPHVKYINKKALSLFHIHRPQWIFPHFAAWSHLEIFRCRRNNFFFCVL